MDLVLFSGFLGSGKTSLILPFARWLVGDGRDPARRLLIVENEVGEVPIDQKILGAGGYDVRELFAGCICCQLTTDLTVLLNDLAETVSPRWVVVEATGLADPGKIVETVQRYGRGVSAVRTVTVVDAERWPELTEMVPVLVSKQVEAADVLLVNKIDACSPEQLRAVTDAMSELNDDAAMYLVSATGPIPECVWEALGGLEEEGVA